MRNPFLPNVLAGLGLVLAPLVFAQEVAPPEEEDTIEPAERDAGAESKTSVPEEHTVVTGDTLWDLCGRYLSNPWYWPRVWSYNPEISNPHWIYPGQLVRFYPGGEGPGQIDVISREMGVPEPVDVELEDEQLPPEDLVSMSGDYVRAKVARSVRLIRNIFITREEMKAAGSIGGSLEEVEYLSELNSVYLDFENLSAVEQGQAYTIYRTEREIHHPVTGDFIGFAVHVLGVCRITAIAENKAVALITDSVEPILRGDRVVPLMDKLSKDVAFQPNGVELKGTIVGSAVTQLTNLGESHLVFLDQGTERGVQDGNVFEVVRREDGLLMPGDGKEEGEWDESMPMEIWGRIMVVDARPSASTGLVVASLRELRVGDRVMMTVR